MIWKTHQQAGFIGGVLYLTSCHVPLFSLTAVVGVVGAMMLAPFPDVDEPNSVPARGAFPLAWICEIFQVQHRTVTHSALFCYLLYLAVNLVTSSWLGLDWHTILMAWWIGYVTHPLIDMLNPQGVAIMWPFKLRFAVLPPGLAIPVQSKREEWVQIVLMLSMEFLLVMWAFKTTPELQKFADFVLSIFQT